MPQDQRLPRTRRKASYRAFEVDPRVGVSRSLRPVVGYPLGARRRIERDHTVPPAGTGPGRLAGAIHRDPADPGSESALAPETGQVDPGRCECLEQDVLREVPLGGEPQSEAVYEIAVLGVELGERGPIAGPGSLDEPPLTRCRIVGYGGLAADVQKPPSVLSRNSTSG